MVRYSKMPILLLYKAELERSTPSWRESFLLEHIGVEVALAFVIAVFWSKLTDGVL